MKIQNNCSYLTSTSLPSGYFMAFSSSKYIFQIFHQRLKKKRKKKKEKEKRKERKEKKKKKEEEEEAWEVFRGCLELSHITS